MKPQEAQQLLDTARGESCYQLDQSLPTLVDGKDIEDALCTIASLKYEYGFQSLAGDVFWYDTLTDLLSDVNASNVHELRREGYSIWPRLIGANELLLDGQG
ncbi:hypothetical protein WG936_05375 [Corynebacterium sp. H127]|uniref:hypothetical protein n=1 Tax=Corynebacterium sp. H127 TaxID=3133418 RepID=UPI0030B4ED1D